MLTCAPGAEPDSAEYVLVSTLNSAMESMDGEKL